jgi:hypothetical protein
MGVARHSGYYHAAPSRDLNRSRACAVFLEGRCGIAGVSLISGLLESGSGSMLLASRLGFSVVPPGWAR